MSASSTRLFPIDFATSVRRFSLRLTLTEMRSRSVVRKFQLCSSDRNARTKLLVVTGPMMKRPLLTTYTTARACSRRHSSSFTSAPYSAIARLATSACRPMRKLSWLTCCAYPPVSPPPVKCLPALLYLPTAAGIDRASCTTSSVLRNDFHF